MATIYRKTPKGQTEIETRSHRLPPRLRSALIVVDGKRSDVELARLVLQDPEGTLQALLAEGFIEAAPAPARPAAPARAPAAAPADEPAAPPAALPFEQARRESVRALTDLVGPVGEALSLRIERARTAEELRPLLVVAVQIIGNTRGRPAAAAFAQRFGVDAG